MYIIDFDEYLFEAKTSGYVKLRSLGFTIRIRCCSKYESIKGIKKLRLEVYNTVCVVFLKQYISQLLGQTSDILPSTNRRNVKLYNYRGAKLIMTLKAGDALDSWTSVGFPTNMSNFVLKVWTNVTFTN